MNTDNLYDIIGIGIGPFNLGLAVLTDNIQELDCLYIDKNNSFSWHTGLLLPTAKMQVPFYADLVTLADPTSPFTYMNYLKQTGKLFRFAINESYYPYRTEYNDYCQWVTSQLNNLYFGHECKTISYAKKQKIYYVSLVDNATAKVKVIASKHIVIGIGSSPYIPACAMDIHHPNIFHSSEYLQHKNVALMHKNITIIGSGQSAAEIFQDLLPHTNDPKSLTWYTRSDRLYAMDYSKFSLELSSPEYIRYFYGLPKNKKQQILDKQHDLYKGINFSLIEEIYEELYLLSLRKENNLPQLRTGCELLSITQNGANSFTMKMKHHETEKEFEESTEAIILATGYQSTTPQFIDGIKHIIKFTINGQYDVNDNYSIDHNNSIFVQNAEYHTHGFNGADLGLGPHRNAIIINSIRQQEIFEPGKSKTFQQFL